MTTKSYTTNLKLVISSDLSADAKYNLQLIDALAGTYKLDTTAGLQVRAAGDVTIEPQSAAVGGSGTGGVINLGTSGHAASAVAVYGPLTLSSAPLLLDQGAGGTRYLHVQYKSDVSGSTDTAADRTLSVDPQGVDRNLVLGGDIRTGGQLTTAAALTVSGAFATTLVVTGVTSVTLPVSGTLATLAGTEVFTGKTISGGSNTISGLLHGTQVDNPVSGVHGVTGAVVGTTDAQTLTNKQISAGANSITGLAAANLSASAGITYSQLSLGGAVVDADISGTAAIAGTKVSPNFGAQNLVTTGQLRLGASGHTVSLKAPAGLPADIVLSLPSSVGGANQVLSTDGTGGLTWASVITDSLSQYNMRVGDAAGVTQSVDTNSLGDIRASTTAGLVVKGGLALSKLAAVTASRALVSDGAGVISASATTATELGYLSGVTSSVQTQLAGKQATGNYITALTGDVSASGPGSAAATISGLALSKLAAVTSSRALASDGSGVISASATTATELGYLSGVTSSVQTQLAAKLPLGGGTLTGPLVLSGDGSAALNPITKQQFDAAIFGLDAKAVCGAATTANITLSGEQTIDGVVTSGTRVLVMKQSTASQNGIYVSAAGAWTRATDFDAWSKVPGAIVAVTTGTVNGGTLWMCTAAATGTVGSTSIPFTEVSGPGTYTTDGSGIAITGTQFSLTLDGTTLSKSALGIKVAAGGITATELASGLLIPSTKGGTGVNNGGTLTYGSSNITLTTSGTTSLTLPTAGTLATLAGTETLSGKTLTSPIQTNYEDWTEVSTPGNPASGKLRLYSKTDDSLYTLNSSGVETQVGSGAGEKNYITSGSSTATGWTAVAGTSAATTQATVTLSTDTTPGELPRPYTTKKGMKLVATAAVGGGAVSAFAWATFQLDPADYNKKLKLSFDMAPIAGYVASDYSIEVRSSASPFSSPTRTSGTLLSLSTDSSAVTALPNLTGTFRTTFDAPGSSTPYIAVYFIPKTTVASSLVVSDIVVGPGVVVQGAALGPWQTYTLNASNIPLQGTITPNYAEWRRNGEGIDVRVSVAFGTPSANPIKIPLPPGVTGRTGGVNLVLAGSAGTGYAGTNAAGFVPIMLDADKLNIQIGQGNVRSIATPLNASSFMGNGDFILVAAYVPISEYVGSGITNVVQNDVSYAFNTGAVTAAAGTDTTSFGYGPAGTPVNSFASTTVTGNSTTSLTVGFPTPHGAGDSFIVEFNDGTAADAWQPTATFWPYTNQGAASYGVRVAPSSSTAVIVQFGNAGAYTTNATYAQAGTAWSTLTAYKWRVKRFSGGQAVGFSSATSTSAGLVDTNAQTWSGTKTLTALVPTSAAGNVFSDVFTSVSSSPTAVTVTTLNQGQYTRVGNVVTYSFVITLTPTGASTQASFQITAPAITNNFTQTYQAAGTCASSTVSGTAAAAWNISAVSGAQKLLVSCPAPGTTSPTNIFCHVTYQLQ